jgi:hypothetical protein
MVKSICVLVLLLIEALCWTQAQEFVLFPIKNSASFLYSRPLGLYLGFWDVFGPIFLDKHYRYDYTHVDAFANSNATTIATVDKDSSLTVVHTGGSSWQEFNPAVTAVNNVPFSNLRNCVLYSMSSDGKWMFGSCLRDVNLFTNLNIYTTDGGLHWRESNYSSTIDVIHQRVLSDITGRVVFALNTAKLLIVSVNYGASFATSVRNTFKFIDCDGAGNHLIGYEIESEAVILSTDYGRTWTTLYVPATAGLNGAIVSLFISYTGQYQGFLASTGDLYTSNDFGAHWHLVDFLCNNRIDVNPCQIIYGSGQQMLFSGNNRLYLSKNNGANWEMKLGASCARGFYGPVCNQFCDASAGEYRTSNDTCQSAEMTEYVDYYRYQANEESSVLDVGTGPLDCGYPFVSFWDPESSYHPCTEKNGINLKIPLAAVSVLIIVLGCVYVSFVLIMKPESDKAPIHLKLLLGTYYFTMIPVMNVLMNIIVLLRATWANPALLGLGFVFIYLPNLGFFVFLFNRNIRVKFWVLPMPEHLFFSRYDHWGKVFMTGVWGLPFLAVNLIFIVPWLSLGCCLWKLEVLCINRFQRWWLRMWTGDFHYKTMSRKVLDKEVYNMQCASTLFLESIPLLILQIANARLVKMNTMTKTSLAISAFMCFFGLNRYLYYLLYKKFEIVQCPMKISGYGCKAIYLLNDDKRMYPRQDILPTSDEFADANNLEDDGRDDIDGYLSPPPRGSAGGSGNGNENMEGIHLALRISQKQGSSRKNNTNSSNDNNRIGNNHNSGGGGGVVQNEYFNEMEERVDTLEKLVDENYQDHSIQLRKHDTRLHDMEQRIRLLQI